MANLTAYLNELEKIQKQNPGKRMDLNVFNKVTAKLSYRDSALLWFQLNLGEVVTSFELAEIHGQQGRPISHNIRRIFELRDEYGYNILNQGDNEKTGLKLKKHEWILFDKDPDPKLIRERGVNKRIRFDVFERDGYQCQICGLMQGDDDPFRTGHKINLHVGHKKAHKRKDGEIADQRILKPEDFITMCNVCNEGAKNKDIKIITLLDRVKMANEDEKMKIYQFLKEELNA